MKVSLISRYLLPLAVAVALATVGNAPTLWAAAKKDRIRSDQIRQAGRTHRYQHGYRQRIGGIARHRCNVCQEDHRRTALHERQGPVEGGHSRLATREDPAACDRHSTGCGQRERRKSPAGRRIEPHGFQTGGKTAAEKTAAEKTKRPKPARRRRKAWSGPTRSPKSIMSKVITGTARPRKASG